MAIWSNEQVQKPEFKSPLHPKNNNEKGFEAFERLKKMKENILAIPRNLPKHISKKNL